MPLVELKKFLNDQRFDISVTLAKLLFINVNSSLHCGTCQQSDLFQPLVLSRTFHVKVLVRFARRCGLSDVSAKTTVRQTRSWNYMQPNLEPGGNVRSGPPTADLHLHQQHRPLRWSGYHIVVLSLRTMRLQPFPPSPRVSFGLPLPPEQTVYDKKDNIDFTRVFYKKIGDTKSLWNPKHRSMFNMLGRTTN